MRNKKLHYIYPVYFDAKRTWGEGRRVNKKLAIDSPTIQELTQAAMAMKLPVEAIKVEAKYPRFWWQDSGRIHVKKQEGVKKSHIIKKMAVYLKKITSKR